MQIVPENVKQQEDQEWIPEEFLSQLFSIKLKASVPSLKSLNLTIVWYVVVNCSTMLVQLYRKLHDERLIYTTEKSDVNPSRKEYDLKFSLL